MSVDPAASIACIGCGGLVPTVDGPTHRYIGASPGCWAVYGELMASGALAVAPAPHGVLTVDAYAVQHPGVPGPQSTQSVWVHLIALHLILEAGWGVDQAIRIRKAAADASGGWPWLEPPASLGPVTIVDVAAAADPELRGVLIRRWVKGAWGAWSAAQPRVREVARSLIGS